MSYGVRQFLMTDPGGNIIRIGQPLAAREETVGAGSRLEKALEAANHLLYSKGDPQTTTRVIRGALAATQDAPDRLLVQAKVMLADAALAVGNDSEATALLDDVAGVRLGSDDRSALADELVRADELRISLSTGAPGSEA